jgi:hypothetical protein
MSKLRRDLKLAMAGVCSGLFSVSVFLLGARVVAYYEYLRFREFSGYETRYDHVEDLWWVPLVVWQVVLSILASLLMHRYLATSRASAFLRWQAIGIATLAGWGLTIFIAVGMECLIQGNTHPIDQILSMLKFVPVAQFVAAVFASHVLYGSAVQAAVAESLRETTRATETEV